MWLVSSIVRYHCPSLTSHGPILCRAGIDFNYIYFRSVLNAVYRLVQTIDATWTNYSVMGLRLLSRTTSSFVSRNLKFPNSLKCFEHGAESIARLLPYVSQHKKNDNVNQEWGAGGGRREMHTVRVLRRSTGSVQPSHSCHNVPYTPLN